MKGEFEMTTWKDIPGFEMVANHRLPTFEVYEDNDGGLYLCILDGGMNCLRIFENWEYGDIGNLKEALEELAQDKTAYELWDGDLCDRTGCTASYLYEDGLGALIADNDGAYIDSMGIAGRKAFGLPT